jgi:tetratricopeptide (TPR) repeat protein
MQFEISEDVAAELTRVLYAELAAGIPIDQALSETRLHISGRFPTRLDWAIPVLFSRAETGELFVFAAPPHDLTEEVKQQTPSEPVLDPLALKQLRRDALIAYYQRDWEQAELLLAQVVEADPTDEDVQAKLDDARQQQRWQAQYRQIRDLRDAGQWQVVLNALADLEQQHPSTPDPDGHRLWAEGQQRREQQYDAALMACDQEDWAGALVTLEAMLREFPDDAAAQGLLATVQQRAEQARPEREERTKQAHPASPPNQTSRPWMLFAGGGIVVVLLLVVFMPWAWEPLEPGGSEPTSTVTPAATVATGMITSTATPTAMPEILASEAIVSVAGAEQEVTIFAPSQALAGLRVNGTIDGTERDAIAQCGNSENEQDARVVVSWTGGPMQSIRALVAGDSYDLAIPENSNVKCHHVSSQAERIEINDEPVAVSLEPGKLYVVRAGNGIFPTPTSTSTLEPTSIPAPVPEQSAPTQQQPANTSAPGPITPPTSIPLPTSTPTPLTVPDVVGMSRSDATTILQNAGFDVSVKRGSGCTGGGIDWIGPRYKETVVSQSPSAGHETTDTDSIVTITVDCET